MDSSPFTCRSNDNISHILDEMIKRGTTYSIVTLWNEIHGIITYRDYMKLLSKQLKISNAPISIVGLPEDPFKAELAKSKFTSIITLLRKSFPFIEEAKSVIKTFSEGGKERRRYEVSILIVTPKRLFSYSEKGWDLPKIFDAISDKLKKMLSKKRSRRFSLR